MTDREVMQQALEALNLPSMKTQQMLLQRDEAITALRAKLEQPEVEPVALIRDGVLRWHIPHEHYARPGWTAHGTHMLYAHGIGEKP